MLSSYFTGVDCKSPSESVKTLEDLKADCEKQKKSANCCTTRVFGAPQLCRKA